MIQTIKDYDTDNSRLLYRKKTMIQITVGYDTVDYDTYKIGL